MTAVKSTAKKSFFMTNFINKLKANKRTSIILFILHMVSAPLVLINGIIYMVTYQNYEKAYEIALAAAGGKANLINYELLPTYIEFNEAYAVIAVFATGLAVLAGVLIALTNFSYLHKKTQVDMIYSLPMTTTQRFLSDFSAGAVSYLAPFLASSVFTFILCCIGNATCEDWVNAEYIADGMGFGFQTLGQVIFQISLYGIFIMLMVYVLSVLVITCCGNFFEAGAYIFVLNGLIPGTIAVAGFLFLGDLYGIDITSNILPYITKTSPIGAFIEAAWAMDVMDEMSMWNIIWTWLLPFIFVTAIYFGISFLLYRKRKAEDVSKPFVYKLFYYIIITAVTFCIATIFIGEISFDTGLLPMIITSAIVYFIAEIITNRGFKQFWKSIIRYTITIIVLIIAIATVQGTEGFGVVYYVPSASAVANVEISYSGIIGGSAPVTEYDYNNGDGVKITDKEGINAVIAAHKENLEFHKNNGNIRWDEYNQNVRITYHMISGRTVIRDYNMSFDQYNELIGIDSSDEYLSAVVDCLREKFQNARRYSYSYNNQIYFYDKNGNSMVILGSGPVTSIRINEFFDALETDLLAMPKEEYYAPTAESYGVIEYYGMSFNVSENTPNLIKYLNKNGFSTNNSDINITGLVAYERIMIGKCDELYDDGDIYSIAPTSYYYGNCISVSGSFISENELTNMIVDAQPVYYTKGERYYITINDIVYILPEKYNDKAAKLFDNEINHAVARGYLSDGNGSNYYFETLKEAEDIIAYICIDEASYIGNWELYSENKAHYSYIDYLIQKYNKMADERKYTDYNY